MANRLNGKIVAITGGSQGIGLAIAQRFAQEGADIAFCYRSNKAGADEVVANIQKLGRKAFGFQCDVGSVPEYSCTFPFRVPEGTKLKTLHIESATFDLSSLDSK